MHFSIENKSCRPPGVFTLLGVDELYQIKKYKSQYINNTSGFNLNPYILGTIPPMDGVFCSNLPSGEGYGSVSQIV